MLKITIKMDDKPLPDSEIKTQFLQVTEQLIVYYLDLQQSGKDKSWKEGAFYHQIMQIVEEPLIHLTLQASDNNRKKAANHLGISRGTLKKKLSWHYIQTINQIARGSTHRARMTAIK